MEEREQGSKDFYFCRRIFLDHFGGFNREIELILATGSGNEKARVSERLSFTITVHIKFCELLGRLPTAPAGDFTGSVRPRQLTKILFVGTVGTL